jgi:hypothetical protein
MTRAGLTLVALAIAVAIPTDAHAARLEVDMAFSIPSGEGQNVDVVVGDERAEMTVVVQRSSTDPLSVGRYDAPAQVGPRRVRAQLGRYGALDLRFQPEGKPFVHRLTSDCKTKLWKGTFVGTASYAGEAGSDPAATTAVRGRLARSRDGCSTLLGKRKGVDGGGYPTATGVQAIDAGRDAATLFWAYHEEGLPGARLEVRHLFREGRVTVAHLLFLQAPKATLTYDRRLSRATVAPPAPFTGTASFERHGRSRSWTGDLAVTLMGGELVPLAGPEFKTDLFEGYAGRPAL